MFAAVAQYLANVAGPAGTLLVLDDLHWAGPDAIDLLQALLRAPVDRPLRLLAAYRDTDVVSQDLLALLVADLVREGRATRAAPSILPSRRSSPSKIVNGCGGHPGMKRSTGRSAAQPLWTSGLSA